MKKILTLQDIENSHWNEKFHETFGENLIAAFLHGNCLYEGFDALHEMWQVSLILREATPSQLQKAHALTREMVKDNLKFGFFFSEKFLAENAQIYPLEFLHLSQKNVPLFGTAPLPQFSPDDAALRAECKRELKNRSLYLLREFSRIQAGMTPMDFFIEVYDELIPILDGVFFLTCKKFPQNRAEIFAQFPAFQIEEPALQPEENSKRANAIFVAIENLISSL